MTKLQSYPEVKFAYGVSSPVLVCDICQKSVVKPVIPPFLCPILSTSGDNISHNFALRGNAATFTHKTSHVACTGLQQVHKPLKHLTTPGFRADELLVKLPILGVWSSTSFSPTVVPRLRRPPCPPSLWSGRDPTDYLVVPPHWWGWGDRCPER